jgi:lipopolysaccharide heptosyltransferase II
MTTKELEFKRVLIINPFGIGDVLFTTPIIRNIRENFPNAYIGYICNIRTVEILKANPYLDAVFVFERDYYRALWKESKLKCIREFKAFWDAIKKDKFDVTIDLSLGKDYSFFSWLAGIKKRIGFNFKNRGRFLTNKININGYENKHVVEYYLDLLKYLNINYKGVHLDLFISDKAKEWSQDFLSANGISKQDILVAIIPGGGASWGKDASIKHWSLEGFAKVADKLAGEYSAKILIMGDSKDQDSCVGVVKEMKTEAIKCCGKTDIMQFASLLSRCNLAITNDGGPLHVAVSVGIETVAIFGPVDDRIYGPYPRNNKHRVIKTDLSCQPCYHRFKLPPCARDRECLRNVNVDEVFQAAKELIS